MRSSAERINIAAIAQRVDVDHRISLRYYFRIADNILRQAAIFRAEMNIIDLYVMLLRFSSLVSETIPCHREYRTASQHQKLVLKKKLLGALTELEQLQPSVQQKLNELDRKRYSPNHSLEWPSEKNITSTDYDASKVVMSRASGYGYHGAQIRQLSYAKPIEQQFHRMSLNFPRPKEETLSKHSILGPSGLTGQWQSPRLDVKVQYPSNIDLTPVQIPSVQQSISNELLNIDNHPEKEASSLVSNHIPKDGNQSSQKQDSDEPRPMISFEDLEKPVDVTIARDPSPPPVLAQVLDLAPSTSPQVSESDCRVDNSAPSALDCSESPLELHISTTMMESFMKLAKSNTDRNLETCGVLAGTLKNRKFFISALIIPKQESTSDSCQTTNEEDIFEVQDKRSLFPLGWIHTHPTQSCFMSSIDLHTHYSYQIMLPESVAIVMAPRDSSRRHGIFRLTTPGGMSVIRQCQQRGFHPHDQPTDGGPIYKTCTDVFMNPSLKFEVIDLR